MCLDAHRYNFKVNSNNTIIMKQFLLLMMLLPAFFFGQNALVNGTITDDNGNPLPGATVQVKGSNSVGAITDFDGKFSIYVTDESTTLEVSYIGFLSKEVDVANQANVTISLDADVSELDEVVVVGYGTVLKRDLTGSVASVKVEDNISRQSSTVDQLLQGRASGVQVMQNSANPNSGVSVRIRGTNSLRGNNEPLYVVDGIIISSAGEDVTPTGGGNTGQERQSGLNGINPRDIERIEVLKDASATAIYGSRGANGVILITTKKGKSGESDINTFLTRSFRTVSKKLDVLDPMGYVMYENDIKDMKGEERSFEIVDGDIYGYTADPRTLSSTPAIRHNWQDEVYETGISTNFGASFSGGSEKGNFYLSTGFNDQQGLVSNSQFKSGDIRMNLNQELSDRFSIEARFSAFFSESDFSEGGDLIGNNQSFIRNTLTFRPVTRELITDYTSADFDSSSDFNANPFSWIDDFADESVENRILGSLSLKYKFNIKGLSYELKAGGNMRNKDRRRFYGLSTFQGATNDGLLQLNELTANTYQINNFLRYNRSYNRNNRVNATLGLTYDVRDVESSIYSVSGFDTTQLTTKQPFLGSNILTPLSLIAADQKMFSFLGRLNYTFMDKYVLTASFRRDGVSKFSDDNRYGFFPSFALAWRAGSERFIKNLDLFSSLKFRAGWGQIGNHGIGPYGTLSNYGTNPDVVYGDPNNGTAIPYILNNIANPNLTWETTEQLNLGVDFGFLNGMVSGNVDVYTKITKDLLQNTPIPTSSGFSNMLINRGELENKGVEVGLDLTFVDNDDFSFSVGGNIAFNKTKIKSLGLSPGEIIVDGFGPSAVEERSFYLGQNISRGNIFKHPSNIFIEGEESALFYGWKTDGVFQEGDDMYTINNVMSVPGDIKVVDINQDGVVDLSDRAVIGNPNPDFVYGFNLNMSYKNFSLSMLFNGVEGNDIANGNRYQLGMAEGRGSGNLRNVLSDAYHHAWTPTNTNTTYPRLGYNTENFPAMLDYIIEDGSYLRLNNITLNYNVPIDAVEKKISDYGKPLGWFKPTAVSVYVTGQNLVTWTDYSGYDPEITSFMWTGLIQGVDWNGSPNARNILIGINMNF